MIKSVIKNTVSKETWDKFRAKKRQFHNLLIKSTLNPELKNDKKIVIIGVADYNNLGDHAIAEAQNQFVSKIIDSSLEIKNKYKIVEIPTKTPVRHIMSILNSEDIILFTGGGNLGTKYDFLDDTFMPIIDKYPNNKKLFFPQSYTFNESGDSEKRLTEIKNKFAKSGKNLTITARESKSLELFKTTFPANNVIYCPDIVLSLNTFSEPKAVPEYDVLMLMRDSGEKVLDFDTQNELINTLKQSFTVKVKENDEVGFVKHTDRMPELNKAWAEVQNSNLVITDRLHGMIFAHILEKPCIVFDNYNSKIKMTYQDWLKDMDTIAFIDPRGEVNPSDISKVISKLMIKSVKPFDTDKKYKPLENQLKSIIK